MTARDPWVAIVRAIDAGRGVRLTAREVSKLGIDEAIRSAALSCETECVCDLETRGDRCHYCANPKAEAPNDLQALDDLLSQRWRKP